MYHTARPERRKAVGGMLVSLALTSFLTGVTEPIEFSFMFLAPALYAVHAVLTGLSMALTHLLNIKLGFTFSAGLFDYVLNFGKATNPLLLIPVGLAYAGVYYGLFRLCIVRFDLKTPGREADDLSAAPALAATGDGRGADFVAALGGAANLASVDACTTRLRLIVRDQAAVAEPALKALGARGIVRPSDKALQVVLGPIADTVAGEIRAALGQAPVQPTAQPQPAHAAQPIAVETTQDHARQAKAILAALGGRANLTDLTPCSSRLRVVLANPAALDPQALHATAPRGLVRINPNTLHILLGPSAQAIAQAIQNSR
jgi:PTS system N-acetylglucosamine-specific IIC component